MLYRINWLARPTALSIVIPLSISSCIYPEYKEEDAFVAGGGVAGHSNGGATLANAGRFGGGAEEIPDRTSTDIGSSGSLGFTNGGIGGERNSYAMSSAGRSEGGTLNPIGGAGAPTHAGAGPVGGDTGGVGTRSSEVSSTAGGSSAAGALGTGGSTIADGGTSAVCSPVCSGGNALWACVNSSCVVTGCESSHYGNCNDSSGDGCETDLRTSLDHCGACDAACTAGSNQDANCLARNCIITCKTGWDDCSASAGCETRTTDDALNCGHCSNQCTASGVCRSSTCLALARYGNTGAGSTNSVFPSGYLVGLQIYLPQPVVLTAIGAVLYLGATSRDMYLGLYRDEAGKPTQLIAANTSAVSVAPGGVEVPVAHTDIPAGNYWILGTWNGSASFASNSTATVSMRSATYSTFSALPATAPPSMTTFAQNPPNLYLVVAQ
jgi:hypothetical protein